MERYVCIHGHFYQPARENPWLGSIDMQSEAFPYHDWNEKINAECYMVNTGSHILDSKGRITDIFNNYSRMSFNFGTSLLSWIKNNDRCTYESIIEADSLGISRFSGHGCSIAQIYNHIIMPLSIKTERLIQVKWAISDFEANFKRKPEGMWLSETAVDMQTLDMLAECGIKFTVLSPNQAHSFKKIENQQTDGFSGWKEVKNGSINTRMPYLCRLESGRDISIFFYDNELSNMVAFGDLLGNGESFAAKITGLAETGQELPEIICIASDGETYGHHHRFGEMALSYCLNYIESAKNSKLTVFGEYLEKYPPAYEVRLIECSSWSCSHGVGRWMDDCGCANGGDGSIKGWNQKWRKPLREAVDWLSEKNSSIFNSMISGHLKPGVFAESSVMESYIDFLNDSISGLEDKYNKYLSSYLENPKNKNTFIIVLSLLEASRHCMLMQSSDGWFFDDISGIETIQILRNACRAIGILENITGEKIEPYFLSILKKAKSNKKEEGTGADIYRNYAKTALYDENKLAAMLAFEMLFIKKGAHYPKTRFVHDFIVEKIICKRIDYKGISALAGTAQLCSKIIPDKKKLVFGAFRKKDVDLYDISSAAAFSKTFDGISDIKNSLLYKKIEEAISGPVDGLAEVFRDISDKKMYGLSDFTNDFQKSICEKTVAVASENLEESLIGFYVSTESEIAGLENKDILKYLFSGVYPVIHGFADLLGLIDLLKLKNDLKRKKTAEALIRISNSLVNNAGLTGTGTGNLPPEKLGLLATQKLDKIVEAFADDSSDLAILQNLTSYLETMEKLKIPLNLWKSRKLIYNTMKKYYFKNIRKSAGQKDAATWIEYFDRVLYYLNINNGQT